MFNLLSVVWNPELELFRLFGLPVRYYSLMWCIGLVAAYFLVRKFFKDRKISDDTFEPLFVYCFLGILIGARVGHCIFYQPDYYLTSFEHFIEMLLPIAFTPDGVKMVGYAGLRPTIEAIKAKKTIALANKETLVVAGEIICRLAQRHKVNILPVDSEHSAIFQSLVGEKSDSIEKLLLTASGGPFRTFSYEQMQHVTAAQALQHPNWEMGAKITIDSASMMNKGFEVIEARWLFDIPVDKIQVLVHPQSVVHSAVQFVDGSVKAQLGTPDMRIPIQYALTYPQRWLSDVPRLDFFANNQLTFEEPDLQRFPNLALAYEAMNQGGNMPCILNAANEVVNQLFREGKCGFLQMSDIISQTMQKATFITQPTYEDYVQTDNEARKIAMKLLKL